MSYLSQMAGLAVQNFVSAALGMAVLVAVIRGFARRSASTVGNFWVDFYRSLVYILFPLALILAVILLSQGVVQTFDSSTTVTTLEGGQQTIARGPGRDADRDQAARDERRRLLQLELRRAVREPDPVHEPPRDALDPPHPRRAGVHVRPHGRVAPSGVPGLRGDDGDDDHRDRRCAPSGAARIAGPARLRCEHHRRRRVERRQHVRQGGPVRHRLDRELGGGDDQRIQRLGQRRPRRSHRDGRSSPDHEHVHRRGRSGAASAPASTACSSTSSSRSSSPG